jgi:hypothetical protein
MSRIVVTLEEQDLVELQGILMDRDRAAALLFLESRIASRLPQKRTAGCDSTRLNPYLLKKGGTSDRE